MITTLGCVPGAVGDLGDVGAGDAEDADATLHHIVNNALKRTTHTAMDELASS
jgi:hypothetical protein